MAQWPSPQAGWDEWDGSDGITTTVTTQDTRTQGVKKVVYGGPFYSCVFSEQNQAGSYVDVLDYVNDCSVYGFDNAIDSVLQTGMWMYYENYDFNNLGVGRVYWVHGIDIPVSFPFEYTDILPSEPASFTVSVTPPALAPLEAQCLRSSSLVIVPGPSTVVRGGQVMPSSCIPTLTMMLEAMVKSLSNLGIFPDLPSLGINDNSIWLVRKRCWAEKVVEGHQLKAEGRTKDGAWGYIIV
ncbi:hypothetical protein Pcinc_034256 [Petrolisthes cinctipes]|uniref:Uncharacterized protein n=1 Tax=Petrolisthes cinctipes TaxID=88211 RepID=A0AAE1JX32_PETCI|nr:hypothetical protein Pcinc_034256 [Petrolisthes cinctipes]